MSDKNELINTMRADFARHPDIPSEIYQYIEKVILTGAVEKFLPVLDSREKEKVLQRVEDLFLKVKKILKSDDKKIIKGLDFHPNDIGKGRIDALFAELRTVVWLDLLGFQDIILLASRKRKQADVLASFKGKRYSVEVFCVTSSTYRWPNHQAKRFDLSQDFVNEANEKRQQIDSTARQYACDKSLLTLVLDSRYPLAWLERSDYLALVREVAQALNWGKGYHFALVTGQESLREGPDDVCYPPLTD